MHTLATLVACNMYTSTDGYIQDAIAKHYNVCPNKINLTSRNDQTMYHWSPYDQQS